MLKSSQIGLEAVVSITTVVTWHIRTTNVWTDFEECIIDRAI